MREFILRGRVGSGKKYDSKVRRWSANATAILGYTPFKGTLNVGLSPRLEYKKVLQYESVTPFRDLVAIRAVIENKISAHCCYSIHRKIEEHISTFYIISNVKLRDKLNLSDGDRITIKLLIG